MRSNRGERGVKVRIALPFVCVVLLLAAVCYGDGTAKLAVAQINNSEGVPVGIASFSEGTEGVKISVHVASLPPGYHGLHIHEKGVCVAPDFNWAGGHFNPFGREHGLKNPKGPHAGDLPNLLVGPDGEGAGVFLAPMVTLRQGENSLFRPDGTALVIHGSPDDHMTQPSGRGGKRLACGVIKALE
ncbi:MAG: superoxide dismutase family protein [bacterium]|nr:MAG: superoxide dismutase family protein [bacterium]